MIDDEHPVLVSLETSDPCGLAASGDEGLRRTLTHEYAGNNYGGVHILEVRRVVEVSPFKLSRTSNDGSGTYHVRFVARVSVLSRGDMVIVTVGPRGQLVRGESLPQGEPLTCVFNATPEVAGLRPKQLVPVRLAVVEYPPHAKGGWATCAVLGCRLAAQLYLAVAGGGGDSRTVLPQMRAVLQQARARGRELQQALPGRYAFFAGLLAHWAPGAAAAASSVAAPADGLAGEEQDLLEALEPREGECWWRPLDQPWAGALARRCPQAAAGPDGETAARMKPGDIAGQLLLEALREQQVLNDMVVVFADDRVFEDHDTLWKAMASRQRARN